MIAIGGRVCGRAFVLIDIIADTIKQHRNRGEHPFTETSINFIIILFGMPKLFVECKFLLCSRIILMAN